MTRLQGIYPQHPNLNADNPLIVLFDMCCQFESIVFLRVLAANNGLNRMKLAWFSARRHRKQETKRSTRHPDSDQ